MEEIHSEGNDNLNNYFCLICCNKIHPRKENFKPPNILDDIFLVLSNYMNWNDSGKQFQFQSELFPFCHKCLPRIESVFELNEQVHSLLRQIDQLCANISSDILLSRSKFERILKARNSGWDHDISDNKRKKCTPEVRDFAMEKVCKYRAAIYKRMFLSSVHRVALSFTASVTLGQKDKSIAEISLIPKGPLGKKKCLVKVEIPVLSESEAVLEETMGSTKIKSYDDVNSSAVGDIKYEIESEIYNSYKSFKPHSSTSSEECDQDQDVEDKKEAENYSGILRDRKFTPGSPNNRDRDDKGFSDSEETKVERCVDTDNKDYQPRSSESCEESDEDLGSEILSEKDDNSLAECEGSSRNKPKRRRPNFRIWKLADRIKEIDATHFVFDGNFPFEIHDGVWKCGTCGLDFRTKRYLNSHLLSSCLRGSLKRYKFVELPEGKFKYGGHVFQKLGDDNFTCAECDHVAETQEKAMGHIRSKHLNINSGKRFEIEELSDSKISYAGIIIEKSGDKFKCSDCFHTSGTQAELVNHIKCNHMVGLGRRRNLNVTELGHNKYQYGDTHQFEITNIGLFRCLTCDMHCHRRYRITEHIFVCHIQNRFQKRNHHLVQTSPNEFLYAGKYRVKRNGEDQYECVNCTMVYNRKTIITHLRHRHLNLRKYTCTKCEKTFPAQFYLDEHLRNTHVNDRSFVCDSCGQSFKTKSILMHHIKCRHTKKTNICTHCGKGFSLAAQLQSHLKVHTGIISNPTICEVCGKELPKAKLKDHMVIHGEPPFSCTDCNKKFYKAKSLKAHIATHGGAKPHPCKLCDKAFAFQTGLKYHLWRCHSEQTASLDNKRIVRRKPGSGPYPCDICGRGFFEKRKIEGHKMRYHSELTPELNRKLKEKLSRRRSKVEIYEDDQDFCNEVETEVDAD